MPITIGSIVLKDSSGNSVLVRSLTDADVAQLKQDHTKLLELSGQMDAKENGGRQLAYKDYTQTANQVEMQAGTYYMVPFDSSDAFVEFDPATGKPKSGTVAYYTLMYKGTGDGAVANLGNMEVRLNFDDLAHLGASNTFTAAQHISGQSQEVASIGDDEVVVGKLVKDVNTALTTAIATKASLKHLDSEPSDDTSLQANEIGFYTASNLVVE